MNVPAGSRLTVLVMARIGGATTPSTVALSWTGGSVSALPAVAMLTVVPSVATALYVQVNEADSQGRGDRAGRQVGVVVDEGDAAQRDVAGVGDGDLVEDDGPLDHGQAGGVGLARVGRTPLVMVRRRIGGGGGRRPGCR